MERKLKKLLKKLTIDAIENASKAEDSGNELEMTFYIGEFDIYNMINISLEKGYDKYRIHKLLTSLGLETSARQYEVQSIKAERYEDGRASAIATMLSELRRE